MGGCCLRKIVWILLLFVWTVSAYANCPMADKYRQEGKEKMELLALDICAISYNDDESQMKMAEGYMNGVMGLGTDKKKALYMYQLAAENGNAEAQVKLAELLQTFDSSPEQRKELKSYQNQLKKTSDDKEGFSGEILHPYTLLLLAAERPDNKWYYPSSVRSAPARTNVLLQNYKITPEKRQAAMKDASRWKTRKLLEAAKEILTSSEYTDFEQRLKNNTTRTQAMSELKDRLVGHVEKNKKERSKPL